MVEEQIDNMLEDFDQSLKQRGINLEEYMRMNNLEEETLRDDFREDAQRQLVEALILGEVADVEQLSVRDAEIDDEISTAVLPYGAQAELMRQFFSAPEARRSMSSRLLAQKAVDRLIAIARGENPEIGEPEPELPESSEEALEDAEMTVDAVNEPAESVDDTVEDVADETDARSEAEAAADSSADSPAEESNEDHMEGDEETE